jgi:hypothetical protein
MTREASSATRLGPMLQLNDAREAPEPDLRGAMASSRSFGPKGRVHA